MESKRVVRCSMGNIEKDKVLDFILLSCVGRGFTFLETKKEVHAELNEMLNKRQISPDDFIAMERKFRKRYADEFEKHSQDVAKALGRGKQRSKPKDGRQDFVIQYLTACERHNTVKPTLRELTEVSGRKATAWSNNLKKSGFLMYLCEETLKKSNWGKKDGIKEFWGKVNEEVQNMALRVAHNLQEDRERPLLGEVTDIDAEEEIYRKVEQAVDKPQKKRERLPQRGR